MVTSCKTVVQYHGQHIDIDKVKIWNISFTTRILFIGTTLLQTQPLYFCPLPLLNPWQPLTYLPGQWKTFSILIIVSFQEYYIKGIIQLCNILYWLFSLIFPWRSIPFVLCTNSLFLFNAEQYSMVWMNHSLTILPLKEHGGCFPVFDHDE